MSFKPNAKTNSTLLELIYDEIDEIAFIKKYEGIFDNKKYLQFPSK